MLRLGQILGGQHAGGLGIVEQVKVGNPGESRQPAADLAVYYQHLIWKSPCRAREGPLGFLEMLVYCFSVKEEPIQMLSGSGLISFPSSCPCFPVLTYQSRP